MCNLFLDIKRTVALKNRLSEYLSSKTDMVELEVELNEEIVAELEACVYNIQETLGLKLTVGDLVSCILSDFVRLYRQEK